MVNRPGITPTRCSREAAAASGATRGGSRTRRGSPREEPGALDKCWDPGQIIIFVAYYVMRCQLSTRTQMPSQVWLTSEASPHAHPNA